VDGHVFFPPAPLGVYDGALERGAGPMGAGLVPHVRGVDHYTATGASNLTGMLSTV
jgi:hypothetical protein